MEKLHRIKLLDTDISSRSSSYELRMLKVIAEDYASDNNLFLENVASAWTKLANADRFDGPHGNVCDSNDDTSYGQKIIPFNLMIIFVVILLGNFN